MFRNMEGEAFIWFHLVSSRALMCRNIVVKSPLRGEKMQRTSRGAWGVTVTQLAVPRAAPSSAALGSHLLGNVGNVGNVGNNDMEVQSLQSFYAILCPHVKNVLSWLPRLSSRLSRLSHF